MTTIQKLTEKRQQLVDQLKRVDKAIKKENEREQLQKSKAVYEALAARGLLDKDLDSIISAISRTTQKEPESIASEEDALRQL